MTDEHAAEPPPGAPGQRALGAMESAVRRARESAGAAPLAPSPPPEGRSPAPTGDAAPPSAHDRPAPDRPSAAPNRWLIGSIAVVAALLVAAAVALIVSVSSTAPPTSTAARSVPTTTVAVAPAGPPVISSLSPSRGSAGQSITIAGANFLSTSGQIVATFNGQVAPTACPAQSTCTVTVPSSSAPSAQVVITTAGGTSNAVTFTYG